MVSVIVSWSWESHFTLTVLPSIKKGVTIPQLERTVVELQDKLDSKCIME